MRQDQLAEDERRHYRHTELTSPVRTAYDLARRLDLVEAVVAVDALTNRFGFSLARILELAGRYPRARGRRGLPDVVAHAEPLSESPMETRLRMLIVLSGLPRPVAQRGIADHRARIVAWVDLAYPERRIAIEYDGEEHFTPRRSMRDTYRYTRLVDLGWRVYRYRARDVYGQPERIVAELRRALTHRPVA